MRAIAVTPSSMQVGIIDQPEPEISRPTEVKLRMLEAGVCGTDKEICAFEYGTPPAGSEHLVIGHESAGEVIAVGAAVTRVRLATWSYRWCAVHVRILIAWPASTAGRISASPAISPSAASSSAMASWRNTWSTTNVYESHKARVARRGGSGRALDDR
jgi:NADPH:quinone reductase-like Zn-dependent oxidoreductase